MKKLPVILLSSLVALGLVVAAGCGSTGGKGMSGTFVCDYGSSANQEGLWLEGVVTLEMNPDGTYVIDYSDLDFEREAMEMGPEEGTYQVDGDTVKLVPEGGPEATFKITDQGLKPEKGAVWQKK